MAPKRMCKFTDELMKVFPFIKRTKLDSEVYCDKCRSQFSIAYGGKRDINRHIESDKHKKFLQSVASSSQMTNFFKWDEFGSNEKKLALSEAVFSFHTVAHHQSFRSMDCTTKLIQNLFEKKFACRRTKSEAIIKKVIAPLAVSELAADLESAHYISIFSDASNHKEIKLFPTLIRYFNRNTGVNVKILDFISLPGETSEMIFNSIVKILTNHKLKNKLVAYCADNANTNFGGVSRKGENNIFNRLKNELNQDLIGVGCAAHIIHNAIQTATDLLPMEIEGIVVKIYSHFYIYTDTTSELWLLFLHNQAALFSDTVKNVEGNNKTLIEIFQQVGNLKTKLNERISKEFLPLSVRKILHDLTEVGEINETWFKSQIKNFYANCLHYLENWSTHLNIAENLIWTTLTRPVEWQNVQSTLQVINKHFPQNNISENDLFDEDLPLDLEVEIDMMICNFWNIHLWNDGRFMIICAYCFRTQTNIPTPKQKPTDVEREDESQSIQTPSTERDDGLEEITYQDEQIPVDLQEISELECQQKQQHPESPHEGDSDSPKEDNACSLPTSQPPIHIQKKIKKKPRLEAPQEVNSQTRNPQGNSKGEKGEKGEIRTTSQLQQR
ncbi:unnamed protein product [Brassicogethes aeneus]|uniref:DUF4371 domain-containing protein n=1 Tax=Brassicogethes aeneus TaxID=1431903 RepID=A0A9P0BHU9_BRAAE|nr:unnamed protein product [Brassicogethes aeneus]